VTTPGWRRLAIDLLEHVVLTLRAVPLAEHARLGELVRERERLHEHPGRHRARLAVLTRRIAAIHRARRDSAWLLDVRRSAPWCDAAGLDYDEAVRQLRADGVLWDPSCALTPETGGET
jgi:hypothetical protein